jgi:hypothetical protein
LLLFCKFRSSSIAILFDDESSCERSRPVLRLQTRIQHNWPTISLNCTLRSDEKWSRLFVSCQHVPRRCYCFVSFSFILSICIQLTEPSVTLPKGTGKCRTRWRIPFVIRWLTLDLIYIVYLDKDKDLVNKRLIFRESYHSYRRRQLKISTRKCHDYSLYMKVKHRVRTYRWCHVSFDSFV